MARKIIQIATSVAVFTNFKAKESVFHENLYALDSDGIIWAWNSEDNEVAEGWIKMLCPWDNVRPDKPTVVEDLGKESE